MAERRRRKMIVGFVEVENAQDRAWRHAASGMSIVQILAEGSRPRWKPYHDGGHTPEGRVVFWCAADKPIADDTLALTPIYRTTKLPDGAQCETCGIALRDLQDQLTETLEARP